MCLFGSTTVFLGQEVHYDMVYIAYFTKLSLQICDYAQKRRICRENCNYAFDERFHGHVCPRRKPAKSCHPDSPQHLQCCHIWYILMDPNEGYFHCIFEEKSQKHSNSTTYMNIEQCGDHPSFWNTARLLTDTIGLVLCSRPPPPTEADNSLPRPSPWAYPTLTYLYLDL